MNTLGYSGNGTSASGGVSARLLSLMLLLALAVVMWGLHDKLSLYQHTGSAPAVAKAKLLSGRDNAQALQAPSVVSPELRLSLLLFALLPACLLPLRHACSYDIPRALERQFWRAALYRRPPPFFVSANVWNSPVTLRTHVSSRSRGGTPWSTCRDTRGRLPS